MANREAQRRKSSRSTPWLINGVLAGVGGVFVSTTSVVVTAIAAAAAVAIAVAHRR